MSMFAQTHDTLIPPTTHIRFFEQQPVQSPVENFVFLYPGKIQRDTISACEFTYVKNRKLRHAQGQIVEVSQNWHIQSGGQGQVVERKVLEYYIISEASLRYEIKNKVVGKWLMSSVTVPPSKPLKCFKRKPQYVWDIKLQ